MAAQNLGVTFATVDRAIRRLVDEGIVTPLEEVHRGCAYYAKEILAILEERADMKP